MKRVLGIIIILLISTAITYGAKPTISISDLKSTSGITKEEVVQLTSKLVNELVMTDAFEVIDRAKRDEILREQGFNVSGATDPSLNLIKIGKLLGVQKMIGGSIGKLGNV
ncbi:MAG: CsgG/HfaB family protein, partial [bacterium]|nr:CsgG/HfaB family protein [bacterium]